MKISIKNDATAFTNYITKQQEFMFTGNDFIRLLTLFHQSIKKNTVVYLRFDTDDGLDELVGKIIDVKLIIDTDIDNITIKIKFKNTQSNKLIYFECDNVGSSTVEYNTHSVPNNFTKIYIKNPHNYNVSMGLIFEGL